MLSPIAEKSNARSIIAQNSSEQKSLFLKTAELRHKETHLLSKAIGDRLLLPTRYQRRLKMEVCQKENLSGVATEVGGLSVGREFGGSIDRKID